MKQTLKIPGLNIVKKLAEGGQGEVFLVHRKAKAFALKLYNPQNTNQEQRETIAQLVESGGPAEDCADRFAWPLELVDLPGGKRFGYLMPLIDTTRLITLADIESGRVPHPGYGVMAEAGRQLAECFRELHIAGYCYRDISKNNFMFCPKTGDVVICDNDNIVVETLSDE